MEYPKFEVEELENVQGWCPICKEECLDYGEVVFEGESCYFPWKCDECGLEGREWYSLSFVGHSVYDENGNDIEIE